MGRSLKEVRKARFQFRRRSNFRRRARARLGRLLMVRGTEEQRCFTGDVCFQ